MTMMLVSPHTAPQEMVPTVSRLVEAQSTEVAIIRVRVKPALGLEAGARILLGIRNTKSRRQQKSEVKAKHAFAIYSTSQLMEEAISLVFKSYVYVWKTHSWDLCMQAFAILGGEIAASATVMLLHTYREHCNR